MQTALKPDQLAAGGRTARTLPTFSRQGFHALHHFLHVQLVIFNYESVAKLLGTEVFCTKQKKIIL